MITIDGMLDIKHKALFPNIFFVVMVFMVSLSFTLVLYNVCLAHMHYFRPQNFEHTKKQIYP